MKLHNIPEKVNEGASCFKRFSMNIFFTRYEQLEKNNFPLWTETNAACLLIFIIGFVLLQIMDMKYKALPIAMIIGSFIYFIFYTYFFTAPTISRIRTLRRGYLLFIEYIMCQGLADTEYITGTNMHGYLPHLTARKIIDNYVTDEEFEKAPSLAIVRNPYTRMVSIYMYNRFGPCESFSHFVKSWYSRTTKDYRERGEMEEWYTPCHAIPQFEFTHDMNGTKKLVHYVVKQEELKYLKKMPGTVSDRSAGIDSSKKLEADINERSNKNGVKSDETCTNSICSSSSSISLSEGCSTKGLGATNVSSINCVPEAIRRSLLGMPHENKRSTTTPWYEYFDQETLNLTYEMYHRDFDVFGYDVILKQRPDLRAPRQAIKEISL